MPLTKSNIKSGREKECGKYLLIEDIYGNWGTDKNDARWETQQEFGLRASYQ